uniref:OSJNBb0013O03.3 protein n=1 Tax=Oryza sativa subsp. japonica TaxID=39947 RepID=Q7XW15_ORYSJ|nr:OSJNBb0013O03.3 [Oryza sativa Japonica Group]
MATPVRFSTKPHVFDGTDFYHWCSRMQSYIMAEDYDIWRKVSHPYVIPEAINTAAEKIAFEQNCKARNILLSGISRSDYDRVAHFRTAHEIWNALSNFHQGTNNIKKLRRDIFKNEYIKFEMKPGEAMDGYLSRFNKILSDLRSVDSSYDTNYPQYEISRHFLNGLDMSIWEMKVTSIQESVNMSTLSLDSLYTKLKTHEMNVLSRKVDSKSSALVSSSSFLDVDASSSKPSFLAVFNATSDDQLEQIEEGDLALVANRIARAMNNPGTEKELGRGKREDKDGEKTNNNKPKGTSQGRKFKENLRRAFDQVYATFEPLSDVDGESGDDDKGKNISSVCFMARVESDIEYEDHEVSAFEEAINILSAKNMKCEKMYRKQEFIIESLNSEIARLKSLIPNDDDCENCEVLMNKILKIRDVNAAHDLKNKSSLALSFALHTRTLDELFLTKTLLQKYQIAFHASLMFNMISAKKLKQSHDVLVYSTCNLNKMKLKHALGHVEYMEDVVKNNEVLSCPKCRKSKGVMVDCENCANLEKEVSYLKNSLLRFSDGKKNLNMILDQSKISTHNRGLGFNPYADNSRHPPVVLGVGARSGEILFKPDTNKTVFKSAGIMSTLSASSSKSNVVHAKPPVVACVAKSSNSTNVSNHREKYTCSFCGKDGHMDGFCFRLAHKQKKEKDIAFAKSKWQKSGFPTRNPVRPQWVPRSDRRLVRPATEPWSDRRKETVWIVDSGCSRDMTSDKNWFSSLKKASKTESIIFGDASTSAVLITDFEVHFKKTGSKVFDSCGDSVLNISCYERVFKADFENPVLPVITCLVSKFDKDVMFWHRRFGHVGFDHLTRLSGLDLVRGLHKLKKDLDLVCTPRHHAKMVASSHAPIVSVMTDAPGQLLHMEIVGPVRVQSVGGKWYVLVIVDDFSQYSWVFFMATKDEAFQHFRGLFLRLNLEFPGSSKRIRCDNGGEFKNTFLNTFAMKEVLNMNFLLLVFHNKTVLLKGKTVFWSRWLERYWMNIKLCKCFILKSVNLDKFEERSTDRLFIGYPAYTRGYRVLILASNKIVETCEVSFDEASPGTRPDIAGTLSQVQGELKNFLLAKGVTMGKVNKTLFVLKHGENQLFVQIYVDDIIFGCSSHALVVEFAETMRREFEMSMMGELDLLTLNLVVNRIIIE